MRYLFGTDETYYAIILIFVLMVCRGLYSVWVLARRYLFNLNIVDRVQIH